MAAIVGKSINSPKFGFKGSKKSVAGSAAMFAITLIIASGALVYLNVGYWLLKALVISIIATVVEAISIKGTDNITIPLITSLMIFIVT
jgi:phytol kinase